MLDLIEKGRPRNATVEALPTPQRAFDLPHFARTAAAIGTAGLLGQIDRAATRLNLGPVEFGNYLFHRFGTDDLGQLSPNDLRRVLRQLRLQLEDCDELAMAPDRFRAVVLQN